MSYRALLIRFMASSALLFSLPAWSQTVEDPWEKSRWIHKVAKALGQEGGLGEGDQLDQLLQMEREQIVDTFMNKPTFGDASLAAFLHFFGRSVDTIKSVDPEAAGYRYHPIAFAVPQALASARSVLDNRELEMFVAHPSLVLAAMTAPQSIFGPLPEHEQRAKILEVMLRTVDSALETLAQGDKLKTCEQLYDLYQIFSDQLGFTYAGFDPRLEELIRSEWLALLVEDPWGYSMRPTLCSRSDTTTVDLHAPLVAIRGAWQSFFDQIPLGGTVESVKDLIVFTTPSTLPPLTQAFTREGFWEKLRNTSTNFNRKRSAYMLRTYFCDELGPIAVEPSQHSSGRHASDPACLSCHYKMDPLAGLFRNYGMQGTDFEGIEPFMFDDFIELEGERLQSYYRSWKNESDEWVVGYYVEPGVPHPGWKGDRLSDFFEFAKTAKDVQQCFVRRMAEHFVGPALAYDGAWLNELTDDYMRASNSGVGFKNLVKRLVLSQSFATFDPVPGTCYDVPANTPANRPPCVVASIVQGNCKSCHNSGFSSGGLDLSQWVDIGSGVFSFPHKKNGVQLDRKASLEILRKRITGTTLGPKMPPGRIMVPTERQKLYEWLSQILEQ
ncbi:hypothetical protein [Oligoflexus tunisiensis]|uniref:hypothetical protein n=1 Tax=Oligoflexus tunisiensis TaxID=708132 RepID=UPI00114D18F5|nr:hypothetical protein [Oligoflexus tunisiensis]